MPLPTLARDRCAARLRRPDWQERNNRDAETRIRRGTPAFEFKPEAEPLPGEPVV
jgi:hypothetical protein